VPTEDAGSESSPTSSDEEAPKPEEPEEHQ
jgi:hypothetical protein